GVDVRRLISGGRHCKLRGSRDTGQRWVGKKVPLAKPGYSGSSASSPYVRWRAINTPRIRNGTDRNAPIGPHSQVQNARLRNTASGLSVRRRPTMLGGTKWPSRGVSGTERSGAIAAEASEGEATSPAATTTT